MYIIVLYKINIKMYIKLIYIKIQLCFNFYNIPSNSEKYNGVGGILPGYAFVRDGFRN